MASPTLIAFSEADTLNVTAQASASLTWQTGDILVAIGMTEGVTSTWSAPTNAGSGLSWVQQQLHNSGGTAACGLAVWTAIATAGSSGAVTVNQSAAQQMAIGVYQFRGTGGSIAVGVSSLVVTPTATSGSYSAPITMTSADSSVVWASTDTGGAAVPTGRTPTATSHSNVAPGPTASPFGKATNSTYAMAELDDQASTGSQSYGFTGSGATTANLLLVILEITFTPAAAQAAPLAQRFLPRNTTGRGVRNLIAMRQYARTPPTLAMGVTFTDAVTGVLIFGGTVQEGWTWRFPQQGHARRLPIARGLRDPAGLRGYTRTPVALRYTYTDTATGAWIFASSPVEAKRGTDALSGAWIFAGSRVEAKRGTDARSGSIIFGGSRAEAITFVQARSGSMIFGGTRTELKRGTDARSGSVIFGGSQTELKRYGDVRSGTVIFGGSATQLRVGTDARTGTIIFGGHSSTAVTTTARVKATYIIPDARGRRRRTRW